MRRKGVVVKPLGELDEKQCSGRPSCLVRSQGEREDAEAWDSDSAQLWSSWQDQTRTSQNLKVVVVVKGLVGRKYSRCAREGRGSGWRWEVWSKPVVSLRVGATILETEYSERVRNRKKESNATRSKAMMLMDGKWEIVISGNGMITGAQLWDREKYWARVIGTTMWW